MILALGLLPAPFLAAPAHGQASPWAEPPDASPDGPEHVKTLLTVDEALAKAFPQADSLWTETWAPTAAEREALELSLGWVVEEPEFVVHRAAAGGQPRGWAVVTEQVGKHKPITFLVKVDPDGRIGAVHVLVYRESRGDQVKRQRFLGQYRGKGPDDPIRLNRDIIGATGATYSSLAITAGVKRVLAVIHQRYLASAAEAAPR